MHLSVKLTANCQNVYRKNVFYFLNNVSAEDLNRRKYEVLIGLPHRVETLGQWRSDACVFKMTFNVAIPSSVAIPPASWGCFLISIDCFLNIGKH